METTKLPVEWNRQSSGKPSYCPLEIAKLQDKQVMSNITTYPIMQHFVKLVARQPLPRQMSCISCKTTDYLYNVLAHSISLQNYQYREACKFPLRWPRLLEINSVTSVFKKWPHSSTFLHDQWRKLSPILQTNRD